MPKDDFLIGIDWRIAHDQDSGMEQVIGVVTVDGKPIRRTIYFSYPTVAQALAKMQKLMAEDLLEEEQ